MKAALTDQHHIRLAPLILAILCVGGLWATYWWVLASSFTAESPAPWAVRGQFGDMFGAFTALITALGFAGLLYTIYLQRLDIRQQTRAIRHQELTTALTAQIDTLIQIHAMPEDRRRAVWTAIASAPGGPGRDFPIEQAIVIQIHYLDRLAQGDDITTIPTYGHRRPDAEDS
jgi:hypothetical protein